MGLSDMPLSRHCGLDPQSPEHESPLCLGDGGFLSAMTV